MTWDSFRQRVRFLRGEALSGWPSSVTDVRLQNVTASTLLPEGNGDVQAESASGAEHSLGVRIWCTCTVPAHGLRRNTLMHCSIPSSAEGPRDCDYNSVLRAPVAAVRSVWMDSECGVRAAYSHDKLPTGLKNTAIEHALWSDTDGGSGPETPAVVLVMDKGQQWVEGSVEHRAAETHMRFSESTMDGGSEGDWYYCRGGRGGRFVAFSREGNVWVYDTRAQQSEQVTWATERGVQYGAVDLAMEEELGRTTGIFWAPCGQHSDRMLCARVDERAVLDVGLPELPVDNKINPVASLVSAAPGMFGDCQFNWAGGCTADGRSARLVDLHKYPRPGTPNASTDWVIVEIEHDAAGIRKSRTRPLLPRFRLRRIFPWCEYVVRAGWLPDESAVWLQLLDRAQRRTAIVRVPLACFGRGTTQHIDPLENPADVDGSGAAHIDVLYEETQPRAWVNLNHCQRFLAQSSTGDCVQFIIASERTHDFNHLYLVTSRLRTTQGVVAYALVDVTALTTGMWPVTDDLLFVNEQSKLVYFTARRPNPLTTNLFVTSYARVLGLRGTAPDPPQQLTLAGYTHSDFAIDASGTYFYCQSSNLSTPVRHCVYQIHQSTVSPAQSPRRSALAMSRLSLLSADSDASFHTAVGDLSGLPSARCLAVLEMSSAAIVSAQRTLDVGRSESVLRAPSLRVSKRLSTSSTSSSLSASVRSQSADSIASDEFFVERLLSKLRASGQQIQHSTLRSDLAKLKRLTPAYVSQRVTKAVKSALPFCTTPTLVPLHLLHGGSLFQPVAASAKEKRQIPPPLPARPPGDDVEWALLEMPFAQDGIPRRAPSSRNLGNLLSPKRAHAPPLPPTMPRLGSSLTPATRAFAVRETLAGTHNVAGLPERSAGGDPVPRLFSFPVPRVDGNGYELLFGHVYLPPDFQRGTTYPVLVNAYGGPQCQLVTNAFPYPRHRRLAMLTRMTPALARAGVTPEFAPSGSDMPDDGVLFDSFYNSEPDGSSRTSVAESADDDAQSLFASTESALAGMAMSEAMRQPSIVESIQRRSSRSQALRAISAMQPTVVVCIDGRGTPHRGLQFEAAIAGRMGRIEVDDIVSALEYLSEYGLACLTPTRRPPPAWCRWVVSTTLGEGGSAVVLRPPVFPPPSLSLQGPLGDWDPVPLAADAEFVDPMRVAIHGWSYGGYVALQALARRPEWFRVAISGAPVVRWDWYNAAYIERYLGVLDGPKSRQAYQEASLGSVVGSLADPSRLLLVHGWSDDNVHVAHTAEVVRQLKGSSALRLAIYANERHGLRLPASNEHFETLLSFWLFHSFQL